jgi:hypothetical protein
MSEKLLLAQVGSECVILLEGRSRMPELLPDAGSGAAWVGRTPHGFIVNVVSENGSDAPFTQGGLLGAMLPVRIESAARRSLKGRQAGRPC